MNNKPNYFNLNFLVSGDITQEVIIIDKKYTPKSIIKGLNSGKLITTIFGDEGEITTWKSGKVIARVTVTEANLEYSEYDNISEVMPTKLH